MIGLDDEGGDRYVKHQLLYDFQRVWGCQGSDIVTQGTIS